MTYLMSVFMGFLQGVAEFLPISSSGHLALFQAFFGMENMEETQMFFTVLLHFGTLISVFIVYWRDIVEMIREFFLGIAALVSRREGGTPPPARRMVLMIIIATLPLFAVLLIKDKVDALFGNTIFVSCALIATDCHRLSALLFRPYLPGPKDSQECHGSGCPDCGLRTGRGHRSRPLAIGHNHLGGNAAGIRPEICCPVFVPDVSSGHSRGQYP